MKRLFRSTIAKSLFGSFIVVMVPIILLSLLANYLSMNIVQKEIENSYETSIKLLSTQFSERLQEIESLSNAFELDDDLIALNNSSSESTDDLMGYVKFVKKMNLYMASRFMDEDISLFLMSKGRVLSTKYGICKIDQYQAVKDIATMADFSIWTFKNSLHNNSGSCLSMIRGESYVNEEQYKILVSIEISTDQVIKMLNSLENNNGDTTFIIDSEGNILTNSNTVIDKSIISKMISQSQNDTDIRNFSFLYNGINYRSIYSKLNKYNIIIGMLFDEKQLVRPINKIRDWLIICLVSSLFLSIIFLFIAYRSIISPVNSLVETMKKIKAGDLSSRVPVDKKSDLGFMFEQFNTMVGQLDKLIHEVYISKLKLKQSQVRFLQSQINPHFLYNSLFCLYNMIKNEDTENAANMTIYLGKYFQIAAHSDNANITVNEEINNIAIYINIQTMRHPGKIDFNVNILNGFQSFIIPRLTIQTLVENAIIHGIENLDRNCSICIELCKENEYFNIVVENDGVTISEEKIAEIEEKFLNINYEEDHHGILNVYCRLKLMFGDDVKMLISRKDPGTSIAIKIPYQGDATHV